MTLDQLKSEFAYWRANKANGSSQIPQQLWDEVFLLEKQGQSISSLCRELSISGTQIANQRIKQNTITEESFIEIAQPELKNNNRCDINLNFKEAIANINVAVSDIDYFLPKIKGLFQ